MNFFRNNHEARKSKKASRATELGIAGHQAAMKALGDAAGWERYDEDDPKGPMAGKKQPVMNNRGFAVGAPHVRLPHELSDEEWDSLHLEDKMHIAKILGTTAKQRDKGANYGRK